MKQNYKPLNPLVRCPKCNKMIVIVKGRFRPHHPKGAKAADKLCPTSGKQIGRLEE